MDEQSWLSDLHSTATYLRWLIMSLTPALPKANFPTIAFIALSLFIPTVSVHAEATLIPAESLDGKGVWISPDIKPSTNSIRVAVWFDKQLLGDGEAYSRRAKTFSKIGRQELRKSSIASLKKISADSHKKAEEDLNKLIKKGTIKDLKKHWVVNGFSCSTTEAELEELSKVEGVKKIFLIRTRRLPATEDLAPKVVANPERPNGFSDKNLPWYISALKADKVWKELGVTGQGTLNVIHDKNFIYSPSLQKTIYRNPHEIPGNGKDDDGNGLIDDVHGYNFVKDSASITTATLKGDKTDRKKLHGTSCAHIVSGAAWADGAPQFGLAPMSQWAGVIAGESIESALEWAIEQGADTYSMSFTKSRLGETRSHWRKLMEHGTYCGVFFVSGAGNYALKDQVPVQMRVPQSIPEAVFAAAGVQQDLSRTPFSSKGPVHWDTEHYTDGKVSKPEVCAFNFKVPLLMPDGKISKETLNGNSFAGPMFCGSISLMISADPDLLPWDLKEIITSTATDVGPKGVDYETGHGLINCYRAVKEVIRRRDLRKK